jgi:uncharacterized protein DUF6184
VKTALKTGLCAATLALMFGCNKENDRPASAANDQPSKATNSATTSLAEARCAREARCDNVGPDKKYSTVDDCLMRTRADWESDLNARECPGGVNQKQLDECLSEVRSEDCNSPLDTLERVAACTSGQICQG